MNDKSVTVFGSPVELTDCKVMVVMLGHGAAVTVTLYQDDDPIIAGTTLLPAFDNLDAATDAAKALIAELRARLDAHSR